MPLKGYTIKLMVWNLEAILVALGDSDDLILQVCCSLNTYKHNPSFKDLKPEKRRYQNGRVSMFFLLHFCFVFLTLSPRFARSHRIKRENITKKVLNSSIVIQLKVSGLV